VKIIAIDPDLNGSIVVIEDMLMIDYKRIHKIPNEGGRRPKNIVDEVQLYSDVHYLVEKHDIELAYIEEPMSFSPAAVSQFWTFAAIRMALIAHDVKVKKIDPYKWKKFFNLIKKTKRDSIKAAANIDPQLEGTLVKNNSLCESYLIGLYAIKFKEEL